MLVRLDGLRGESPRIVAIRTQVAQLLTRHARTRRLPPVLILGETGSGKGVLARSIHQASARRDAPFVTVNCAAIPETLLEAELFGYERGAFTDARQAKIGLFQAAQGGTLFLDEIGLLPAALQGKLLGALEDRAVRRLGSTRAEPVDVAVLAATSADLKSAVSAGLFREDLYHRLAVITLSMPPLRDRGADILLLAEYLLARACADYGLAPRLLTADARGVLANYRWPGNVRELANAMERVALLSETEEITADMLAFLGDGGTQAKDRTDVGAGPVDNTPRTRIEAALRETGGNIRRTAAALGISRNTLRARMDRYGLRHHRPASAPGLEAAPEAFSPLDQSGPLPPWERRHLASLRARIAPGSPFDRTRVLEVIEEKVRMFGGRIEEAGPTGVIAVFGLEPVDNAPSLAALAALAIQNAAARARAAVGERRTDVVIGVHYDEHFVRRLHSGLQIGFEGKAATWAALDALVGEDAPHAIFVTEAVVPFLDRRFVIERLRTLERKVLTLLRRERGAAGGVTRFVGRDAELQHLSRAVALAADGHGQVVSIVGEPGVGKSRLVRESTCSSQTDGWLILHTEAIPYGKTTPYLPVIDLLKTYFGLQDSDDLAAARDKVTSKLLSLDRALEPALPAILTLLDVLPDDPSWQALDPPERRQRMLDSVRRLLVRESQAQPVLIVVEDLQWLDRESQALLDRLVESLPSAAVMLLVNYRPEYQHSWHSRSHYRQIQIAPLPRHNAEDLLRELIGPDPALAPLSRSLIERTDGNPFFLEECVRAMVETGVLAGEPGAYRLGTAPPRVEVPLTVRAVLAARIDRLAPRERGLLEAAAVIGNDVPFALLRSIGELPADDLALSLSHLQTAELLYETRLFPDLEYAFKHPLTHEAAYGSLLPHRRRALHARIVQGIEELHAHRLAEHFERLAYHASRGELWEKALLYLRRAGAKALARSAYREAADAFEQALVALGHLPPSLETIQKGIDIRIRLYWALFPVGEYDAIPAHLKAAEALAKTAGDQLRLGTVSALSAGFRLTVAEYGRAREYGEQALAIGTASGDVTLCLQANFFLGQAYHGEGQYARARDCFTKNLDAPPADLVGTMFSILSCAWSAWSLAELGDFSDAMARAERAVEAAEALGDHFDLINAVGALGMVFLLRGDVHNAIPRLERCLVLTHTARNYDAGVYAAACLGHAYALSARHEEAVTLLERSVNQLDGVRRFGHSLWLSFLGHAYLHLGRTEAALERARLARELSRQNGERGSEAYAMRLLGEIASHSKCADDETASTYFCRASELAEELGMRPLVAHCHLGRGKLYRHTNEHEQALEHLTTAATMYRDMGMTYWLERAEAAMVA